MEVRLSDFAEIVGTTTATIRNAIQLNKLPFLDTRRHNDETKQKIVRRTYSAADAFGWFLYDEASKGLGIGQWNMAGIVQACWPRGLRLYTHDFLAGNMSDDPYLIFATKFYVDETRAFTEIVLPRFGPDGSDNIADILSDHPFFTCIRLVPVFERFRLELKGRGWLVDELGLRRIENGELQ
ncbi:hypothetical protein FB480_102153 [Agrobacterium vitis]|nr:hypothetical protein FB480_102153 [Agrobacterium vitis]